MGELFATVSKADQARVLWLQERDRLLQDLKSRSRRMRVAAQRRLVTDFVEDIWVKQRLDLADSSDVIGQYQKLKKAEELRVAKNYREVTALCDDVLKVAKVPAVREEALKIRRKSMERSMPTTQRLWNEAVTADMRWDAVEVKGLLTELQQVVALKGLIEFRQSRLATD